MQEIFLDVWRSNDVMTDENGEKVWIAVIARNTAVDIRRKKEKTDKNIVDIEDALYENIPSSSEDLSKIVVDDESVDLIYTQIRMLDKKYSDVLLLKYKFCHSTSEIAELLGIKEKTCIHA